MHVPKFRVGHRTGCDDKMRYFVIATAASGREYTVTKFTTNKKDAERWCKRLREASEVHTAAKSLVRQRPMWVALDKRGRMRATWYRECVQPFRDWKKAVTSLGYTPVRVTVVFPS